jgi:hypothetical protein
MSLLSRNILFPLFAPDSVAGPTGGSPTVGGDMSKEDMIEFMADDEESSDVIDLGEKPGKTKKDSSKDTRKGEGQTKEETETDEETTDETSDEESDDESTDDELQELEQELEGPTEEQLELVTPVRRREILKKYPNLFKEFPYLEKAYYREQQFTELLPTIDDARAAVEKSQTLDKFEADVIQNANTENILRAVKEENPEGFLKLVDNYLPTLAKVDEKAYLHLLGNISKHTIFAMVTEARKLGLGEGGNGHALQSAAHIMNQFIFGSSDFVPPTNLAKENPQGDKKVDEIKQREQQFVRQQLDGAVNDMNSRINNTLKNTINAHIDPKQSMTEYIRGKASQDALDDLQRLINQDSRFKALADRLWEAAIKANFSRESVDRVKSAWLSKSKTLLPTVIKKARIEALKGMGKRPREDNEEESQTRDKKGPITPGAPRSQEGKGGKISKAKDIPRGMSTLDFLNS